MDDLETRDNGECTSSAGYRHGLQEMKPSWTVGVFVKGGAWHELWVESGQTYGQLKKQLIKHEEQVAERRAEAALKKRQARQVQGLL